MIWRERWLTILTSSVIVTMLCRLIWAETSLHLIILLKKVHCILNMYLSKKWIFNDKIELGVMEREFKVNANETLCFEKNRKMIANFWSYIQSLTFVVNKEILFGYALSYEDFPYHEKFGNILQIMFLFYMMFLNMLTHWFNLIFHLGMFENMLTRWFNIIVDQFYLELREIWLQRKNSA